MSGTLLFAMAILVWLFGLAIGSFLNVVIYRLNHELSIAKPTFSFCPHCKQPIRWHDNIPLVSWLLLGGRCRDCHASISLQYPLVEAVTGLTFVLVFQLLFIADARSGLSDLTLPADAPLLAAWLVTAGALIVCAAMDVVFYHIDLRVTYFGLYAGILLMMAWPRESYIVGHTPPALGGAMLAALLASAVVLWLTVWRKNGDEPPHAETEDAPVPAPQPATHGALGPVLVLFYVGLTVWLLALAWPTESTPNAAAFAAPAALLGIFLAIVLAAAEERPSDDEIHDVVLEEAPHARRTTAWELVKLLPIIAAGVIGYLLVDRVPNIARAWDLLYHWPAGAGFAPLAGLAHAAHGAIVAAGVGWGLRIVFTLAYGREAFALGDIYMLGMAGAAIGWDVTLLGLVCAVGFAMAGWLVTLPLKRVTMIPFGPWLAIGFLAALWLDRPAGRFLEHYRSIIELNAREQPALLLLLAGVLLVVFAVLVFLTRLLRHVIEREE